MSLEIIFNNFQITEEEYQELEKELGNLCHFIAWDLKKRNSKSNLTDEQEDIAQEMRWSICHAGVYTKRQRYIEDCIKKLREIVSDHCLLWTLDELQELWDNRTRHGANKQRFGVWQENVLAMFVQAHIPVEERPDKKRKLQIDKKFVKYCKSIVWNKSKNLGKKISRDRCIRFGQVSLSEHSSVVGIE